ncbi:hypothetical protein FGO68_gene10988 [Halteria grandinella]|uniref:Uncharacterized protein n=1 Tax=Halteria grandinella TaxID=5974 RepID=A0A8J8SZQ0_HALGN|nr:hypothetical protein FGO68_gene10988 [Halteria grandinella]
MDDIQIQILRREKRERISCQRFSLLQAQSRTMVRHCRLPGRAPTPLGRKVAESLSGTSNTQRRKQPCACRRRQCSEHGECE